MFVEATRLDGSKIYVNLNRVLLMVRRQDGTTYVDFGRHGHEMVKEPPKKLCQKGGKDGRVSKIG